MKSDGAGSSLTISPQFILCLLTWLLWVALGSDRLRGEGQSQRMSSQDREWNPIQRQLGRALASGDRTHPKTPHHHQHQGEVNGAGSQRTAPYSTPHCAG